MSAFDRFLEKYADGAYALAFLAIALWGFFG